MRRAAVVIGANYGDEGKGHVVDYLAARAKNTVVVRFNGGAQAGHTVVTPDGTRHVFSHFGSGTMDGAATYLAKHFVCNPILFFEEVAKLRLVGPMAADPRCYVTTGYDMIINQTVEDHRGAGRHGSVGVGFGETIERNQFAAFRLLKDDLKNADLVKRKMRLIRDTWLPLRLRQLKIPAPDRDDHRLSDQSLERMVEATLAFDRHVPSGGLEYLAGRQIVFEGAQGLALDMDGPGFPHVTRSNTGLTNVVPIAKALGLALDVIYVTRTFLTRHGAGPLPNEYEPNPPIKDDTNLEHPYQGKIRFGMLDVDDLRARVEADQKLAPKDSTATYALTWLDYAGADALAGWARKLNRLRFYSLGPRRDQMMEIVK